MIHLPNLVIDPDIRRADTLPGQFYTDPDVYLFQKERIFARTWQCVGGHSGLGLEEVRPITLLPGCLDEPLVLTRDAEGISRCLSNVCTHRGNLVVTREGPCRGLRCEYHGRRFGLDGVMTTAPLFDGALDFPAHRDNLPVVTTGEWGPLTFASINPAIPFETWIQPILQRVGFLPIRELVFHSQEDFQIEANWALYCDNYLEGFHVPYVHPALGRALDYRAYTTETLPLGVLQIGEAAEGVGTFTLPEGHPDAGRRIAAFYFWLFPNLMLNFYPWGLSVNVIEPRGVSHTCIRYLTYVWPGITRNNTAGEMIGETEAEDEAVVQSVQKGVRSRLYKSGRYAPEHEVGVHHFHRLLCDWMQRS